MADKLSIAELVDFIGREIGYDNHRFAQIHSAGLDDLSTSGEILGPLKVTGRNASEDLVLTAEKIYFSRFRVGDIVEIAQVAPGTTRLKKNGNTTKIQSVQFPAPGRIEIVVPGRKLDLQRGDELFLFPTSMADIHRRVARKLREFALEPTVPDRTAINRSNLLSALTTQSGHLNKSQTEALRFIIENDLNGLIQGPPGTGKTHVLISLIKTAMSQGLRVGLAALSHAAVDNALSKVLKSGVSEDHCVRISSDSGKVSSALYSPFDATALIHESLGKCPRHYQLYAATMHSWLLSGSTPEIDVLIIDEASQVPIFFSPYLAKLSARIIMFGDHRQLPPVMQTSTASLPAEDIFSYAISNGQFPMLETQYRMNANIQDWSSRRFYQGRLRPHESVHSRDILTGRSFTNAMLKGEQVNLLSHNGRSTSNANPTEATLVAEIVAGLRRQGGLESGEIGVVSPHRAHAGAICAKLQEKLGLEDARKITVDTVERFQGQEREAMVFSFGVERNSAKTGAKEFLGDGRRLNVAVTRARSRFYCLAPRTLINEVGALGSDNDLADFLKWCDGGTAPTRGRTSA
jgi:DNA replication ATP-dependent helicase Dna2